MKNTDLFCGENEGVVVHLIMFSVGWLVTYLVGLTTAWTSSLLMSLVRSEFVIIGRGGLQCQQNHVNL